MCLSMLLLKDEFRLCVLFWRQRLVELELLLCCCCRFLMSTCTSSMPSCRLLRELPRMGLCVVGLDDSESVRRRADFLEGRLFGMVMGCEEYVGEEQGMLWLRVMEKLEGEEGMDGEGGMEEVDCMIT